MGLDLFGFSGGGAFNKSSASNTTSTTNSLGLNFSEVGTVAAPTGDDATINMLDGGVIASAFDYSRSAGADAYDFARAASKESFGIASDVAARSVGIASEVAAKSVQDAGDVIADLSKWLIAGLVVVSAAYLLKKKKAS